MSFNIKQATIENLDGIVQLFNEYRIFYKQDSDIDGAKKFIFDRFEHMESIIFIAIENETNNKIGFTQLYPSFSSVSMKRSLILNDLYVSENYRKNGVGKLLLNAAKSYAIKINAKGIGLSTAIDNNTAQKLYENNGYKKNQDFYQYYLNINIE
jgi:ribosomal protein S18 acetylase RimI-like enzyme